jgi:hypothetical protein
MQQPGADFVYLVVPLTPGVKEGDKDKGPKIAQQVQALINDQSRQGWEFYRVETVYTSVAPGCMAGLAGAKAVYMPVNQVVFKKRQ